jgi:hypothetical protein
MPREKGRDVQEPQAGEVVTEVSERTPPVRRSLVRAAGSIVLWILAAVAFVFAAVSAAVAVALGSFASSVTFYLLIGLGLVFFGVALWRRHQPRPRRLTGRILTVAGVASLVASVVISSVLGTGDTKPVLFPSQRYEVSGGLASVSAPGTDGWQSTREKTDFQETVSFARDVGSSRTAAEGETLRAHISVGDARGNALPSGDLIAQALDTEKRSNTTQRMTDLRFTTSTAPSRPACMRYDWSAKDTGVARFPGSVFRLNTHGLMCTNSSATHLINVGWSHRYLEGSEPKVAESTAEPFLASLQVTEGGSPGPSPLASPLAPGTVLFRDTFKDSSGRWRAAENEFARMGYLTSGGFGIELRRRAHAHASTGEVPVARDIEIEVDYRVTSTAEGLYGPTCRLDDTFGTFYVFVVTNDGRYAIQRNIGGRLTTVAWSAGTVRSDLVAPASLKIVAQCYGDGPVTLVLTVNGTMLLRLQDTDGAIRAGGRASFYANGEAGPATRLESFTVREIGR